MRPIAYLGHRRHGFTIKARAICAGNRLFQLLLREIRQEAGKNAQRALLIIHGRKRGDLLQGKLRELSRHIQASIRRKAAKDRHGRRNSGSAAGGKHLHKDSSFGIKRAYPL